MKKFALLVSFFLSMFSFICITNAEISISPLIHEFTIEKGKTINEKIKVTNQGTSPVTLYTSTEDFISGDNSGQPQFIKPGDQNSPELSLSNWVNVKEKNITLSSGETREIDFSITVPSSGEPGGHYGAIFFSPGIQGEGKIAYSQRIGVLLLVDVPGETKISGKLESFKIGEQNQDTFNENNNFKNPPITFEINFKNEGNIHLKPQGKIELIDQDGNILKSVGKKTISSPTGAYLGEELVDYIPFNDILGNVLPNSSRNFYPKWEGFGYTVLNQDGTKTVNFKSFEDYYKDIASEKQQYLMFREQIHTKNVKKKITAKYEIFYESKDKDKKEFSNSQDFYIEYNQSYVGINYYIIILGIIIIGIGVYFGKIYLPKSRKRKEEELRKKIIEEINKK